MKKKMIFKGTGTALVTPFRHGEIDYGALDTLIEEQIAAGIDALVVGGTTGEAATLSREERARLYEHAAGRIGGRTRLLFGTGTNDTAAAVEHTRMASALPCDGVLVVTPYYNKGTRAGIVEHYRRIADASRVPVLLYNVPSRTGVCLGEEELATLAEEENISGIKEAADSADRLVTLAAFGDSLYLYAGNDTQYYTVLALGGMGVISVASNLLPSAIGEIGRLYAEGRHREAAKVQIRYLPLIRALFRETNPAPVKYAMSLLGKCTPDLRLPLSVPGEETRERLRRELQALSLL